MKKFLVIMLVTGGLTAGTTQSVSAAAEAQFSELYPEQWEPGYSVNGKYLPDFSYAGYKCGEEEIPASELERNNVFNVKDSIYGAKGDGMTDDTDAIRKAVSDAAAAASEDKKSVVYMPEGIYCISRKTGENECILIESSNVILKGAGKDRTMLINTQKWMRDKNVISIGGDDWSVTGASLGLSEDAPDMSRTLKLNGLSALGASARKNWEPGKFVRIRCEITEAFKRDVNMITEAGIDRWSSRSNDQDFFYREIEAVDFGNNTINLKEPINYGLKTAYNPKVKAAAPRIRGVGLEDFSVGNLISDEHFGDDTGWEENDHSSGPEPAYKAAGSHVFHFMGALDCWAYNIGTCKPKENEYYHVLSNVFFLENTKNITLKNCSAEKPRYRGANGNGYGFHLRGNDNLLLNCCAAECRHNYTFSNMVSNGNAVVECMSKDPSHVSDFHMYLSMANLIDSIILDGDTISAVYRNNPASTVYKHGMVTTQSVIWNAKGIKGHPKLGGSIIVESQQLKNGYIIGTSGINCEVNVDISDVFEADGNKETHDTSPVDHTELIGYGDRLKPQSLYKSQLAKRLGKPDVSDKVLELVSSRYIGSGVYEATLKNNTDSSTDVSVIMAAYNGNRITSTSTDNINIQAWEEKTFLIEAPDMDNADRIKIFLWDSLEGLVPYCEGTKI